MKIKIRWMSKAKFVGEEKFKIIIKNGDITKKGTLYVNYVKKYFCYDFNHTLTKNEKILLDIKIFYEFASMYYYINRYNLSINMFKIEDFKIIYKDEMNKEEETKKVTVLKEYITNYDEELSDLYSPGIKLIKEIKHCIFALRYWYGKLKIDKEYINRISMKDRWMCEAIIKHIIEEGWNIEIINVEESTSNIEFTFSMN